MKQVSELLTETFNTNKSLQVLLATNWKSILGPISQNMRFEIVKGDKLIVGVYEIHWMQELYCFSNIILKKINDFIGKQEFKEIQFKLIEKKTNYSKYHKKPLKKNDEFYINLTELQKKVLNEIVDLEFKQALIEYLSRCLR